MGAATLPTRRRDAVFARFGRVKNALSSKSPAYTRPVLDAKVPDIPHGSRYDRIHEEAFEQFRTSQPQAAELLRTYIDPGQSAEWHDDTTKFMAERLANAEEDRLRVRLSNGKTLIIRDVLAKFTKWVRMVVAVGDTVVQFDPVHAALPWAAFRFVLQSALNYHEADEAVWDGIERLCHELIWVNLQETLYLNSKASHVNLCNAFVAFYIELFTVLVAYLGRLDASRGARLLLSPFVSKASFQQHIASIDQKKQAIEDYSRQMTREAQLEQSASIKQALDHLASLQRPVDRLLVINELMYSQLEQEEQESLLSWISDIQQADHYSRSVSKALAGTGQWLFDSEQFIQWRNSSTAEILRFHGKAGSGKSTLFSVLLRRLKQDSEADGLAPPVYFYCARTSEEPKRAQPLEILRCLLRQLSQPPGSDSIQQSVLERYRQCKIYGELQEDDIIDLCLSCIETRGPTNILVDALDESDPTSRDVLLGGLVRLLKESSQLVKIFVTSRDQRYESMILEYPELFIAPKDNINDINLYITSELDRMEKRKLVLGGQVSSDLRSYIIESLSTNADGMFRWVALQLQTLKHFLEEDLMREHLGKLPADLSESYRNLFEFEMRHLELYLPGTKEVALRTFKWLMIVQEQLSSDDFCKLVGHANASCSPKPRQHLLQYCFSLVEYDETTDAFRFCHLSVREFFESASFRSAYPEFEETQIHASVAARCLDLTSERCSKDFLLPEYALVCWTDHARDAGEQRIAGELSGRIRRFLSDSRVFDAWRGLLCRPGFGSLGRKPWPTYWRADFARVVQPLTIVVCSNFYELVPELTEKSSNSALTSVLFEGYYNGEDFQYNLFECAAYECHLETLKALLDLERDRWATNRGAHYAFVEACYYSRTKTLQFLLEQGSGYSVQDLEEQWAVFISRGIEDIEMTRVFLDHAMDVNYRKYDSEDPESGFVTPLMRFVSHVDTVNLLLARGADVNIQDHRGEDALLKACSHSLLEPQVVTALLQHGADANTRDKDGVSALMTASSNAGSEIARLLLAAGANVNAKDHKGEDALLKACSKHWPDPQTVATLLQHGADANTQDKNGVSALMAACSNGSEGIRLLLAAGANVNAKDHKGEDALLKACSYNFPDSEIVATLLEHGADANTRGKAGKSALMAAATLGSGESVRLLLAAGADADLVDDDGRSAIEFAESFNVIETLLEHRRAAGKCLSGEEIQSVSRAAADSDNPVEAIDLLTSSFPNVEFEFHQDTLDAALVKAVGDRNVEAVVLWIEKGAAIEQPDTGLAFTACSNPWDIDGKIDASRTLDLFRVLIKAGVSLDDRRILPEIATWSCPRVVELLLDNGIDVNSRDRDGGDTALGKAAQYGDVDTMQLLLARGADINAVSDADGSSLTWAVWNSHMSAISLLLENGADADIFGGRWNPLTSCAYSHRLGMAELILDRGADVNAGGGKLPTALTEVIEAVGCCPSDSPRELIPFIRLLYRHGADSKLKYLGYNALDYVSRNLEKLKDPTFVQDYEPGQTAAAISGWQEVAVVLRDHGAETSENYARWSERKRRKAETFEVDGLDNLFDLVGS